MSLISFALSENTNGPYKGLGGPPGEPIVEGTNLTLLFENEVINSVPVYVVLYAQNTNFQENTPIDSFSLSAVPVTHDLKDYIDELYLDAIEVKILLPDYIDKNIIHQPITYDGYFVNTFPEHIEDYISDYKKEKKATFITTELQPGDFFPFILRIQTKLPLPTVFKMDIAIRTFVGVM